MSSDLREKFSIFDDLANNISINAIIKDETIWLNLNQISLLFERDKSVILKHIKNVYHYDELEQDSTIANFAIVQKEGSRNVQREVAHYNLDMILSVGYRVNSKRGTKFRKWANEVLKKYIVKGYAFNQNILTKQSLDEIDNALEITKKILHITHDKTVQENAIDIIQTYTKSWQVLLSYDEETLKRPQLKEKKSKSLIYSTVQEAIASLKNMLIKNGEAKEVFGIEKDNSLKGILGNIEQTFDNIPLYKSIEEKAAHLLYFIIKDHPFTDGNKRIGSMLFLLYLTNNNVSVEKINDSTLVALALIVAESDPKDKDLIVKLILNLL